MARAEAGATRTHRADRIDGGWRRTAIFIALVLMGLGVAAAGSAWLEGWRWFVVQTPSMGQAAPVGTVVITAPAAVQQYEVGSIISFHPPQAPDQTYTHRIVSIARDGAITTRGDINGASDGWRLPPRNVIGTAVAILPAAGFVLRSFPLLLIGCSIVWLSTRFMRNRSNRAATRATGTSLVVAITAALAKPFVNFTPLVAVDKGHGVQVTVVSTGLLPIRIIPSNGDGVSLIDGRVGSVFAPFMRGVTHYAITADLDLAGWQWLLLVAICLAPMAAIFAIGLPSNEQPQVAAT